MGQGFQCQKAEGEACQVLWTTIVQAVLVFSRRRVRNKNGYSSLSSMGKDVGGDAQRDAPVNYPYDILFISSVLWVCGS